MSTDRETSVLGIQILFQSRTKFTRHPCYYRLSCAGREAASDTLVVINFSRSVAQTPFRLYGVKES